MSPGVLKREPTGGGSRDEVDPDNGIWTVPAERMKSGREHRVPLSAGAASVLEQAQEIRENDLVFTSATGGA